MAGVLGKIGNHSLISGSSFINNKAADFGGALVLIGDYSIISGSNFIENKAGFEGSGIYTFNVLKIINPGEIRDNKAGYNISDITSFVKDTNAHITGKVSIGDNYENYIYSEVDQDLKPSNLSKTTFDLDLNKTNGVSVYNKTYYNLATSDVDGNFELILDDLLAGNYTATVLYSSNDEITEKSTKFTIPKTPITIELKDFSQYYGQNKEFTAILKDKNNNPIANQEVIFTLNNVKWSKSVSYILKTDKNGIAKLPIRLYPGKYDIEIEFLGNENYSDYIANNEITVLEPEKYIIYTQNFKEKYNAKEYFQAILKDSKNNPIAKQKIKFTLTSPKWTKSAVYTVTTDVNGLAKLFIGLNIGEYNIKTELINAYPYKADTKNNKITVLDLEKVNLITKDTRVKYLAKQYFQATIKDKNNKPLANKIIKMTFNSKNWKKPVTYTLKTNTQGIAKIQINLLPGLYTIKTEFLGDTNYKKSTITNKLTVIR